CYTNSSNTHLIPFFYSSYAHPPDLHSFPTRRSSDLDRQQVLEIVAVGARIPRARQGDKQIEHRVEEHGDRQDVTRGAQGRRAARSEEHTSELQSPYDLVCRLLLEKKKKIE